MIDRHWILLLLLPLVSCRGAADGSRALATANLAALEETVDMESRETDADEVLLFDDGTVNLGELPLGGSREVRVGAKNGSDKPVVVVEAYSSCDCTQVTYDRKPVQPGGKGFFTVRFSAEQPGTFFKKIAVRHSASDKPVTFAVQGIVTADE